MADPLLLHTSAARLVTQHLRAGSSVNLVGTRSSGRSSAAAQAATMLEVAGHQTLHLSGIASLSDRPFGSAQVAGIESGGPGRYSLPSIVKDMELRFSSPAALVVDDADDLDRLTCGAIAAAQARTKIPVLAVTRLSPGRRGAASQLVAALSPCTRIEVGPLLVDGVHALLQRHLGEGPIESTTLARITMATGGIPGLVVALAVSAREAGRLVFRDGAWVARGSLWMPEMAPSLERLLTDVDDECAETLRVLAMAGAMSVDEAGDLLGWQTLDALEGLGLLRVSSNESSKQVSVFPPMLADLFRSTASEVRAFEIEARLNRTTGRAPSPSPGAHWRSVPPPWLLEEGDSCASLAQRVEQSGAVAVDAARSSWEARRDPESAARYLVALLNTPSDSGVADDVMDATPDIGDVRARAALAAWSGVHIAFSARGLPAALNFLAGRRRDLPQFDGLLRAVGAHLHLMLDRIPSPELLRPAGPDEEELSHQALIAVRAEVLVAQGEAEEALELTEDFLSSCPAIDLIARMSRDVALLLAGRALEALDESGAELRRARSSLDVQAIEVHSFVVALVLTAMGRKDDLSRHVAASISLPRTPTPCRHFRVGTTILGAIAAHRQGKQSFARTLARNPSLRASVSGPFPGMLLDTSIARMVEDEPGSATAVGEVLWKHFDDRFERGFIVHAALLAALASEFSPRRREVDRLLSSIRDRRVSVTVKLLAEYALAVNHPSPTSDDSLGRRLRDAGFALHGGRAELLVIRRLRESGDNPAAALRARETFDVLSESGSDVDEFVSEMWGEVGLSARESEIVELVELGLSNSAIADALVLSVRTVENHVLFAFRKVGVTSREALVSALSSWLSPSKRKPQGR
jgi:DNA-binding CsgD family transcriptional regulator